MLGTLYGLDFSDCDLMIIFADSRDLNWIPKTPNKTG